MAIIVSSPHAIPLPGVAAAVFDPAMMNQSVTASRFADDIYFADTCHLCVQELTGFVSKYNIDFISPAVVFRRPRCLLKAKTLTLSFSTIPYLK